VHQLAGLMPDGVHQQRVAVTQRADRDAHAEVEVALPRVIPQSRSGPSHWDQWKPAISGKNVLGVEFWSRHGFTGKGRTLARIDGMAIREIYPITSPSDPADHHNLVHRRRGHATFFFQ
jgi:hypothetical protein